MQPVRRQRSRTVIVGVLFAVFIVAGALLTKNAG
jgi:hypothetical protein